MTNESTSLEERMDDIRTSAAEQTILAVRRVNARVIAFAGLESGSGTSAFAALAATILARSGQETLLIDFRKTMQEPSSKMAWVPGQGEAKIRPARTQADFAQLTVQAGPEVRFMFDNIEWFRGVLERDLSSYDNIVLDLAPLFDRPKDTINSFAAAAACDALVLVCRRGHVTREKLKNAVDTARATGCQPFGIVMMQSGYVSPGEEIAQVVRRFFFFAPGIGERISRRLQTSELLS
jgi:Mrp family chromosome partitioning ATPase